MGFSPPSHGCQRSGLRTRTPTKATKERVKASSTKPIHRSRLRQKATICRRFQRNATVESTANRMAPAAMVDSRLGNRERLAGSHVR